MESVLKSGKILLKLQLILLSHKILKKNIYLQSIDNCLFCHQSLYDNFKDLIYNYWVFIKSLAEANVKTSQQVLDKIQQDLLKLNFEVLPEEDIITIWFKDKYQNILIIFK